MGLVISALGDTLQVPVPFCFSTLLFNMLPSVLARSSHSHQVDPGDPAVPPQLALTREREAMELSPDSVPKIKILSPKLLQQKHCHNYITCPTPKLIISGWMALS